MLKRFRIQSKLNCLAYIYSNISWISPVKNLIRTIKYPGLLRESNQTCCSPSRCEEKTNEHTFLPNVRSIVDFHVAARMLSKETLTLHSIKGQIKTFWHEVQLE